MLGLVIMSLSLAMAQEPKDETSDDSDEIVCKVTEIVGSKIPERICRTKARWAEIELEMRESRRSTGQGSGRCNDGIPC